ncbi:WcbI family polysaccharide biosynthesis putative acetyltransferase [Nocardioides terrigena]|uniref:WcbI family polysaccharide biosynthesis putative acetyltransferase n=1 Tax=Nocardioides terrigena TaxID=424797 RepID=UPI00131F2507|nr:WcbI family polysaccharide biosynthesis putative acetyltransferase [Nocardioides terrigena]
MDPRQALKQWKSVAQMYAAGRRGEKRLVVIHGNCQAEALRHMLSLAPAFRERYVATPVPPVHMITRSQLRPLMDVVRRTDVFITQPIRDNLRGMPIGTAQVAHYLPSRARTITFPSMYFDGFHPYQVTVHAPGADLSTAAPLTDYHDLRLMHAAAENWDARTTQAWLDGHSADEAYVRAVYSGSMQTLEDREEPLDTKVTPGIREHGGRSFFTLNHPSNLIVGGVAAQVLTSLGLSTEMDPPRREYLDSLQAPVDSSVLAALRLPDFGGTSDWRVRGQQVDQPRITQTHLAWYTEHPQILESGLAKHLDRMTAARFAT